MTIDQETLRAEIARAQGGDAAAEQRLIEQNMPLVLAISKRYIGRGADYDDLRQLGAIGLLKAIRRFDASYDVCFSTYAVPLIAGEIKRFLRDDGLVKFSRGAKQLAASLAALQVQEPALTLEELAARLHVSKEDVAVAVASAQMALSLDSPDEEDGNGSLYERTRGDGDENALVNRLMVDGLLAALPPRERTILELRYRQNKTQSEIGALLGISQVQVSRLEKRTLLLLRSSVQECR